MIPLTRMFKFVANSLIAFQYLCFHRMFLLLGNRRMMTNIMELRDKKMLQKRVNFIYGESETRTGRLFRSNIEYLVTCP